MSETVSVKIEEKIAIVTYHHPPVNATGLKDYDSFTKCFRELDQREDISAIILRSEGKGFMAGNDIHEIQTHTAENHRSYQDHLIDAFESISNCRYPVICAVHGYALGAGLAFVAASDMVIAAEGAFFALPEVTLGVVSCIAYLMKLVPDNIASYMALTGERLDAERLYVLGGVHQIVKPEELDDAVMKLAKTISNNPPHAVQYVKEVLRHHSQYDFRNKFIYEDTVNTRMFAFKEKEEAARAFFEKRSSARHDEKNN